jgi:hypothetical protein
MLTVLLLRHSVGASSRCSWEALQDRIELQGPPQAPQREVAEWIPRGIGRDAGRILVSPRQCLAVYDRMSHPNFSAIRSRLDEFLMESSDAGRLVGRPPTETYIIT